MGEAVLSLRVDWRKDGFAVDLKSSPQGLPDLLCVCNLFNGQLIPEENENSSLARIFFKTDIYCKTEQKNMPYT